MLHYIRFYNHHIFIFLTLILHKLFSLPIYILIYTSTSASLFQLGLWKISKYCCCATENSATQVCNCDNCDLVLELTEYENLTFMCAAMEGLSDVGAPAVLSRGNSWVFLPLCDPELSYKKCAICWKVVLWFNIPEDCFFHSSYSFICLSELSRSARHGTIEGFVSTLPGMGTDQNSGGPFWTSENTLRLWGWESTGTSCPWRWWSRTP